MDKPLWERLVTVILFFFANRVPTAAAKGAFPALFAFGDSILDTGNNNNLATLTKCNFPPYGRNFYGGRATGRFCDGKIPSDLIASALGIKETLPAYLNPSLGVEDLLTGVSFASGGTGNDAMTASIQGVLSLPAQLRLFREYIGKLRALVGPQRTASIISNSLYLFSCGNNDIAITHSSIKLLEPFSSYANSLVASASNFLQSLHGLGARGVWVLSTLPLGCLPGARTVVGGPLRVCAMHLNMQAQEFNAKLASAVYSMKTNLPNFDIRFIDVYTPLLNIIQNPAGAGFIDAGKGCCGTGTVEIAGLCNIFIGSCPNPNAYVFWDSGHPTQRAYQFVVSSILKSNTVSSMLQSYNVSSMLQSYNVSSVLQSYNVSSVLQSYNVSTSFASSLLNPVSH